MLCVLGGYGPAWADGALRELPTKGPILPSGWPRCRAMVPRVVFSGTEGPSNGNFGAGDICCLENNLPEDGKRGADLVCRSFQSRAHQLVDFCWIAWQIAMELRIRI